MARHRGSSLGYQSRPSTPKTPTPQKSTASHSGQSPSSLPPSLKRQKILDSPGALPQDVNAKKRAEERDNFCCVLTGIELTEVAHIYPHHSMKQKEEEKGGPRYIFWGHLRLLWSEEKVTAWEEKIFPQGIHEKGQEEIFNLISLSPNAHAIWGQGLFALKPISQSDDKKTLTVQFFWQTKQNNSGRNIPLTTQAHSTEGLEQTTGTHGGAIWLIDKNMKKIKSGDVFELQTNDPVQKPLPNFDLLELQWFLHRLQGMAGVVDVDWDEAYLDTYSDDDDDDDIEDFSLSRSSPPYFPPSHVNDDKSSLPMNLKHQEAKGVGGQYGI